MLILMLYLLLAIQSRRTLDERVNCNDHPIACGIMFRKEHIVEIGMYDEDFMPGKS